MTRAKAPPAAPSTSASTGITNPFPGPQPYDRRDQEYFFGRDEEIEELTSLVLTSSATLLYAPSGAGKSSLLLAGVAPVLERDFDFLVLPPVHLGTVAREVRAEDPPNSFVRAVCEAIGGAADPASHDIGALAEQERGHISRRVLLVLDQFEEVFNAPSLWRQREEFFRALTATVTTHPWLRVVIALRSDYLANLVPYEHLLPGRLAVRYQLDNLTGDQAAQAIRSAFDASGVPLPEPELDRLLGLLLEDAATPHVRAQYVNTIQLQIVCRRLWQELRVKGSTGDPAVGPDFTVRESMVGFVDDAIREAVSGTRVDETFVRWWLENPLITSAGRRAFVLVEEAHADGLPIDAVQSLATARLLQVELRQGSRLVELTHDSMVDAVQASNERWRRGVARRRRPVTLVLGIVLLLLLAAFPLLRMPPPKQPAPAPSADGPLTETTAATEFAGTGGTVVAILDYFTASAPFEVTVAERLATGAPTRTVASAVLEPQQSSASLAVRTRRGVSYIVGLHPRGPESPTDTYSLTVSDLRLGPETASGREKITTRAYGIPLERGTMTLLSVPVGLQGVSGVDVLAQDPANGWAVVRSADSGGIAVVVMSSGVDEAASDPVILSWGPVGQAQELRPGEPAHLQGGPLLFGAFTTDAPNSTLGAAAACSDVVQMYSLEPGASPAPDPADFSTGQGLLGRGSTVLPLDVGAGRHTFLLAAGAESSVDCMVTLRDFGGPQMTSFGAVDLALDPDAGVAASAAALPGDAVLVTPPRDDAALTTVCRGSTTAAGGAVNGRLLTYLPRDDGCAVWLSGGTAAEPTLPVWLAPAGPGGG